MPDLARRFAENPLLQPAGFSPSRPDLKVECLLNPGAFRYDGKTWLLIRVAERPEQRDGKTSLPMSDGLGNVQILEFDHSDPRLDRHDPRIIRYDGRHYLTTLSHLRLVCSTDGIHFAEDPAYPPLFGCGELETYGIEDCRVAQIGNDYQLTLTQASPYGIGVGLRTTRNWQSFDCQGMIFPPHNKDCALFPEAVPWQLLARSRAPVMEPLAPYEQTGFLGNVVFTNGHLVDGDALTIYDGASDSVICGASFSIQELCQTLE